MKCRTTLQARPIHSSPPSFSKKVSPSTPFSRSQHQEHQKCNIRTRLVVRYDLVNVGLYSELKQHSDAAIIMVRRPIPPSWIIWGSAGARLSAVATIFRHRLRCGPNCSCNQPMEAGHSPSQPNPCCTLGKRTDGFAASCCAHDHTVTTLTTLAPPPRFLSSRVTRQCKSC